MVLPLQLPPLGPSPEHTLAVAGQCWGMRLAHPAPHPRRPCRTCGGNPAGRPRWSCHGRAGGSSKHRHLGDTRIVHGPCLRCMGTLCAQSCLARVCYQSHDQAGLPAQRCWLPVCCTHSVTLAWLTGCMRAHALGTRSTAPHWALAHGPPGAPAVPTALPHPPCGPAHCLTCRVLLWHSSVSGAFGTGRPCRYQRRWPGRPCAAPGSPDLPPHSPGQGW
jgi:hypothetical protein